VVCVGRTKDKKKTGASCEILHHSVVLGERGSKIQGGVDCFLFFSGLQFEPSRSKKGDFTVEKYFEIIRSIYSLASLESNPLLFKIF
jgi:hypothetical protein